MVVFGLLGALPGRQNDPQALNSSHIPHLQPCSFTLTVTAASLLAVLLSGSALPHFMPQYLCMEAVGK